VTQFVIRSFRGGGLGACQAQAQCTCNQGPGDGLQPRAGYRARLSQAGP
jgi:hypothetical protein